MNACSLPDVWLVRSVLAVALSAIPLVVSAEKVYRWTDDRGVIHYSDQRISAKNVQEIEIPPQPCAEDVRDAKAQAERVKKEAERLQITREHPPRPSPGDALGPLPSNASSDYLRTLGTGFSYNFDEQRLLSRYWIRVKATRDLPIGTYLEFHFEDPVHYDQHVVVGKTVEVNDQGIKENIFTVTSVELAGIQCRNYEILVEVYSNKAKTVLLGRHRQLDQSMVDAAIVSSPDDLLGRLGARGRCCP